MLPLVALAASVVPALVRLIAGDTAGTIAGDVARVVKDVTGTDNASEAQQRLENPAIAADLKAKLAGLAIEHEKLQFEEREGQRRAEMEALRAQIGDVASARSTMLGLAQTGSSIAWGPVAISIVGLVVSLAFFGFVTLRPTRPDQLTLLIAGTILGVYSQIFAYWLGSSQGSRDKDNTIGAVVRAHADSLPKPTPLPLPAPMSPEPVPEPEPEPTPSAPATPAPLSLLSEICPKLIVPHKHFQDGVSWAITLTGVSIEGAVAQGSPGEPITIRTIWQRYSDICLAAARHYGVPIELVIATIATESGGNPNARRAEPAIKDESVGLMQTLVATARTATGLPQITAAQLLNPEASVTAGTAYIASQRGDTHFDPPLVAAAYNAGSLRRDDGIANRWKLLCYPTGTGQHIDRFTAWFGDCMRVSSEQGWGKQDGIPSFVACLQKQ